MRAWVVVGLLGACIAGCAAGQSQQDRTPTMLEEKANSYGWIDAGGGAGSPFGKFLLIRRGQDACAIRYTGYHRDYDGTQTTFFSSGDENIYASYDWYYQGDGSFDFQRINVRSGKGKLHRGPAVILGHGIILWRSTDKWFIECGPFKLWWTYPIGLSFLSYEYGSQPKEDHLMELAPTKWSQLEEIDFSNSKLRWGNDPMIKISKPVKLIEQGSPFSSDPWERFEWIPLEELP